MDLNDFEILIKNNHYENNIKISKNGEGFCRLINCDENNFYELISFIRAKNNIIKIRVPQELNFEQINYTVEMDLSNCIFEKPLRFKKCNFAMRADFRNSNFKDEISFDGSRFEQKIRFHSSIFEKTASFNNTTFKDLADFWNATFKSTQQFYLTDFLDVTIFSHVKFKKQVQFIYNKTKKETIISFENAVFNQSLDLSRANFWCRLNFWSVKINYLPTETWLYETDEISVSANVNKEKAYKVLRETYRIIKDVFHKEGNSIEAISFYGREMAAYSKELECSKSNKRLEERTTLFFNKYSNNFGTSWGRSLLFVLGTTVIFYFLFLLFLWDEIYFVPCERGRAPFIKHFFEFLNIAKWDIKPFGITDYNYSYAVLFIGRIFIGYGYYQTIQAFRKYGKS